MQIHELRGADGVLYHTTTSVAARLGVSYADAKALIESGRIPSVTAESVGVTLNKPGARIVSEVALEAYRRGEGGVTMMETPPTVFEPGRVSAPPAGFGSAPTPPAKKRSGLKIAGLGCLALIGLLFVVIVIAVIAGNSSSDDAPARSGSSEPENDLITPCQLLFTALVESDDDEGTVLAWVLTLKSMDSDTLGFWDTEEYRLYQDVRDAPFGEETATAALALVDYCNESVGVDGR